MGPRVTLLGGNEGKPLRDALAGDYRQRVHAHLAGDFLRAGHRVGMRRAGECLANEERGIPKLLDSNIEAENDPEVAARAIAARVGWLHDGALSTELHDERVHAEAMKSAEETEALGESSSSGASGSGNSSPSSPENGSAGDSSEPTSDDEQSGDGSDSDSGSDYQPSDDEPTPPAA